mmetsp:Transcript_926/g.5829  ORF Transcript_926/g.5829 Transcript_926/m.5829 type:complete len:87 (+) Transcript_926:4549-4809(+)
MSKVAPVGWRWDEHGSQGKIQRNMATFRTWTTTIHTKGNDNLQRGHTTSGVEASPDAKGRSGNALNFHAMVAHQCRAMNDTSRREI